jgi:two-component system, NarL family, response regulator NreC
MATIVLADDHAIVRQGLRTLLESDSQLEVVGEAADGREALSLVKRRRPDVVIADLMMPGVNGLQLTSNVSRLKLNTRVIVLSMYRDWAYVLEAFKNGASGYVAKESSGAELFGAIHETLAGHRYVSPSISDESKKSYPLQGSTLRARASSPDVYATLTARERSVLQLVVEGEGCRDIADRLKVSLRTIEAHRTSLMRKLKLKNRGALIRFAQQRGVVVGRTPASATKRRGTAR